MKPRLDYRPDVDGLRAVAILTVVLFHAFPAALPGGFIGVDVFFVISGFLISRIIIGGLERGDFSFTTFYAHRARRIFPALILVLCVVLAAGWLLLLPVEYEQLGKHTAAGSLFVQNIVLKREAGYFDIASELKPLMHLWSLAVEEQFYLLYPVLLWTAFRARLNLLAVIAVVAALSFYLNIRGIGHKPVSVFFLAHTRFWELMAGGVLAYCTRTNGLPRVARGGASWLGLALVLGAALTLQNTDAFPGWWALLPVFGACLLIAAGPAAWVNRQLLGHRCMVWVGLISYPLYLWHWPVFAFLRIEQPAPSRWMLAAAVALAVLLAWLTYCFLETPVRRNWTRAAPLLTGALAAPACIGLAVYLQHGVPSRFAADMEAVATFKYDAGIGARAGRCWLPADAPASDYASECLGAAAWSPDSVLLWGDSHAGRLYAGFEPALADGGRTAQFTRDACPPVLDLGYPNCIASNRAVLEIIGDKKPSTVILFAVWGSYAQRWEPGSPKAAALLNTARELRQRGVRNVLLLGPAPRWVQDLPKLALKAMQQDPARPVIPERLTAGLDLSTVTIDQDLRSLAATSGLMTYFSVWDEFCNTDGCLVRTSTDPTSFTTWDYGHMTTAAATRVVERLSLLTSPLSAR